MFVFQTVSVTQPELKKAPKLTGASPTLEESLKACEMKSQKPAFEKAMNSIIVTANLAIAMRNSPGKMTAIAVERAELCVLEWQGAVIVSPKGQGSYLAEVGIEPPATNIDFRLNGNGTLTVIDGTSPVLADLVDELSKKKLGTKDDIKRTLLAAHLALALKNSGRADMRQAAAAFADFARTGGHIKIYPSKDTEAAFVAEGTVEGGENKGTVVHVKFEINKDGTITTALTAPKEGFVIPQYPY